MDLSASQSEDDNLQNDAVRPTERHLRSGKLRVKLDGKKKELFKSIKRKMKRIDADFDESSDPGVKSPTVAKHQKGNRNAKKLSRKIEVGWVHEGRSVRAHTGGGTRKLTVPNTATQDDIVREAKKYFFPGGRSARGLEAEKCTFELRDFSHTCIAKDETVADVHGRVMPLGILRFHLYTTECSVPSKVSKTSPLPSANGNVQGTMDTNKQGQSSPTSSSIPSSSLAAPPLENQSTASLIPELGEISGNTCAAPDRCIQEEATYYVLDATDSEAARFLVQTHLEQDYDVSDTLPYNNSALDDIQGESIVNVLSVEGNNTPLIPDFEPCTSGTTRHTLQLPMQTPPRSPTPPPEQVHHVDLPLRHEDTHRQCINLHRSNVTNEMITTFKDPDILHTPIKFRFINEAGVDTRGVSREAYSAFWKDFFLKSACGECERVPVICPEYGSDEWKAVGRILLKGFTDAGVYPIQLSYAFSVAVIFGESALTSEMLLRSFRMYLGEADRNIIDTALNGEEMDDDSKDEFMDLLSRVDCHTIPDGDSVKETILGIAHKELIQEPKYAGDSIASTAREGLCLLLPDVDAIMKMYEAKKPTPRKIIKLLEADPQDREQSSSLGYLKQFVRGLDDSMLKKFLRFLTGAEVICTSTIRVAFNKMRGFERAPQAHTCGPLLELPSTYSSYTDLRREFVSILDANYLNMDVV